MRYMALFLLTFTYACSSPQVDKRDKVDSVKVAVVNFRVEGGRDFDSHIKKIKKFAEMSHHQGASYLLLPELIIFDLLPKIPQDKKIKDHLDELSLLGEDYARRLSEISLKYRINIIGASIVVKKKNQYINQAFYINESGLIQYQDKMQPTPWEVRNGFVGTKKLNVFKTNKFSFAILICHDSEFPTISSMLVNRAPEVIFVPSQTDDIHGLKRVKYTSAARAVEHMSYVIMTGTSGDKDAPWHSYVGQNFLFTPQNKYFEDAEKSGEMNREELSIFELDFEQIRTSRLDSKQVYPARDAVE
jgi:predicted amidohydrolase